MGYLPGRRNLAKGTIASYRDAFRLLLRYFEGQLGIAPGKVMLKDLSARNVVGFLDWLESERGVCVSTRNQRLAAIRSFCSYAQSESPECLYGLEKVMAIPSKKCHSPARVLLRPDEMRAILAQPDPATQQGFRDQVLLSVLYDTAARVSELIGIHVGDVRLDKPSTVMLHGKGGRSRIVPIMSKTTELLKEYLERRVYNPGVAREDQALFVNQKCQPMSRWGVQYILDKYVESARQSDPEFTPRDKISPHLVRHARASHLLQAGVNLIYIRDLLGHVDVSTTEIYSRADTEMRRQALENAYECLTPDLYPRWDDDDSLMRWLDSIAR